MLSIGFIFSFSNSSRLNSIFFYSTYLTVTYPFIARTRGRVFYFYLTSQNITVFILNLRVGILNFKKPVKKKKKNYINIIPLSKQLFI